jgi:hypothetical protein
VPCHLYHAQTFIGTAGYCSCHLASAAFCLKAALRKPSHRHTQWQAFRSADFPVNSFALPVGLGGDG